MRRSALRIVGFLAGVGVAGIALAAGQPDTPVPLTQARKLPSLQELQKLQVTPGLRPTIRERFPGGLAGGAHKVPAHTLWPRWRPTPTYGSGSAFGNACGINGWTYSWGVENVGALASPPAQLVISCVLVGGGQWPSGQQQFLQQRLCGCMAATFPVDPIPAHTTVFGNPGGVTFRTFQGLDQHPCNDPQYPHAVVTVKVIGQGSANISLCQ